MNENELIYSFAREHVILASGLVALMVPQTMGAGVGAKGLDGCYHLVNDVMQQWCGKQVAQVTGLTDADLFPPEVALQLQQSDQKIWAGATTSSESLDFVMNGERLQCMVFKFPVHGPDAQVLFIGMAMLDTARLENIEKMQKSLESLQSTNQELQKNLVELSRLASTDKLTGAWNRRRLEEALLSEMERLKRYDHPLSMTILDIDFFKKINDVHGHNAGDQVLIEMAQVLLSSLRGTDSLTRWGGEEFVVLCPNTTLLTMSMLAERLRERIAETVFPEVGRVTASLGVAECMATETWLDWFKRADTALYRAKTAGRNQVQIAPETPQRGDVGENVAANFVRLSWHAAYESGNQLIDDGHRGLFADANDLLSAVLSARPKDEVAALVDKLVTDVLAHFKQEEAIISAAGYPGAAEHAATHQTLIDKAVVLVKRFHAGTLGIGELFQFLAHDVVARHMLGADRQFFAHLQARSKPEAVALGA